MFPQYDLWEVENLPMSRYVELRAAAFGMIGLEYREDFYLAGETDPVMDWHWREYQRQKKLGIIGTPEQKRTAKERLERESG